MKIPKKLTLEQFIENARKVHGDKYSYELIKEYRNNKEYLEIICPVHGVFKQKGGEHTTGGKGCDACSGKVKLTTEQFIVKAKEVHGNRYDYSKANYVNLRTPVIIICREHGEFEQIPRNHIHGKANCFKCGKEAMGLSKRRPLPDILETFKKIHGDKYEYVDIPTTKEKESITIRCKKHGVFTQLLEAHANGHGCPKCGNLESKPEQELESFINQLGYQTERSVKMPSTRSIDIFIPDKKIGIEYNGLRWHSEDFGKGRFYHLEKTEEAEKLGIRLIHIYEDEWLTSPSKVKSLLTSILGKRDKSLYARNLSVSAQVPWAETSKLLTDHHLQGPGAPSKITVGLYEQEALVGCMCFGTSNCKEGEIELTRFVLARPVVGAFSKMLKYFLVNQQGYKSIISFSDRRWSEGTVYKVNGFTLDSVTPPSYYWCKGQLQRQHRRLFQKQNLQTFLPNFDENKTEEENCRNNGYLKIWDCGLIKWRMDIK